MKDFRIREEFYYKLKFINAQKTIKPILKTKIDGQLETVSWAWQRPDGGRSFGFSGGHFHDNWSRVEYRRLIAPQSPQNVRCETYFWHDRFDGDLPVCIRVSS